MGWIGLVGLVGVAGILGTAGCRQRQPSPPLVAQLSGTLALSGVLAPVRIVRDRSGVPHIYAQNPHDLFFAQGLVQAQDRLFQMDLWRRSAQGRLSEVLGPNFVERDAMTRRIQYRGDLAAEWASYGADTKTIADAFVAGVNAWVALARERPPEEFVLAGWQPELWAPEDLLNRTDAFVASTGALDEVFRARLVAAVGVRRANQLLGADPPAVVPPGLDAAAISPVVADVIRRAGTPPFFMGLAVPVTIGAVADTKSEPTSGTARSLDHPSPRYLVHLNAPGWNVIGATAPWRPGVAVGHNDRVAWDATGLDADTQDVFVEKLNPANPQQVEDEGRWVDTTRFTTPIVIRGNPKPFLFESEFTRHGAVVASDRARHLAFTVRWSGAEPGTAGELAALALDRAASWPEFQAAVARWKMPARRFTYADVEGRRESRAGALMPIRRGWNGTLPAPAWSGALDWAGWQDADAAMAWATAAPPAIVLLARAHPDRADALLRALAEVASGSGALAAQRTLIGDAVAASMRGDAPRGAVLFAHPLAISPAARRRFNVGPLTPPPDAGAPFAIASDPASWDRSTAVNAPGQSGSPDSAHFADAARRWADGEHRALAFTGAAVQATAESTLTLTPRTP